jgi:glycerol uptake facilitator-like aquaporin
MDNTFVAIIVTVLCLIVILIVARWFRQHIEVEFKGPIGIGFKIKASNQSAIQTTGIKLKDARTTSGSITVKDDTGRGVDADNLKAHKDISISSKPSKQDPKA